MCVIEDEVTYFSKGGVKSHTLCVPQKETLCASLSLLVIFTEERSRTARVTSSFIWPVGRYIAAW